MELSSPRFKSVVVTLGLSFWFFIITSTVGIFSIELFLIFVVATLVITQVLVFKVSHALTILTIINTKIFLGILFIFVVSLYGIFFRMLRVDLLRQKSGAGSYWLTMEQLKNHRIFKQY